MLVKNCPQDAARLTTLGLFTHASNLDPFVITAASPVSFRWVSKRSALLVPVIGWFSWAVGTVAINRYDRDKAVQSLAQAAASVNERGRSVAVSPEGTRSKTGQLADFKKGPFHLATQVSAPVTPLVIVGAHELWPPQAKVITPGTVTLHFGQPLDLHEMNHNEARLKARRAVLEELATAGVDVPPSAPVKAPRSSAGRKAAAARAASAPSLQPGTSIAADAAFIFAILFFFPIIMRMVGSIF